jgi:putative intracellular protease/amidase
MNANDQTTDLELSEVWDALTARGATVYDWCEEGVPTGCQAIRLGDHWLTVDDVDGYQLLSNHDTFNAEMIPTGEVDEDAAIREASDLSGFFAVVGLPGSVHHRYAWFADQDEAQAWLDSAWQATLDRNPVLGTIEGQVMTAEDAFEATYRDGTRVYFEPREAGQGYVPRRTEID